jgi:hypothetical protein
MKRFLVSIIAALVFISAMGTGCGRSSKAEIKQAPQTTLGQELMDIDKAYKEGIISEKEYKELKEEIIEKYQD